MLKALRSWWRSRHQAACAQVEFDGEGVVCRRSGGTHESESIRWAELEHVMVITTAGGPFGTDVFWLLGGDGVQCWIPGDAAGFADLLTRLQKLPGFNNEAVVSAMGSTELTRFECWTKGK